MDRDFQVKIFPFALSTSHFPVLFYKTKSPIDKLFTPVNEIESNDITTIVYTDRANERRIIRLRKVNKREVQNYVTHY